jgi:hypothetical protein
VKGHRIHRDSKESQIAVTLELTEVDSISTGQQLKLLLHNAMEEDASNLSHGCDETGWGNLQSDCMLLLADSGRASRVPRFETFSWPSGPAD